MVWLVTTLGLGILLTWIAWLLQEMQGNKQERPYG